MADLCLMIQAKYRYDTYLNVSDPDNPVWSKDVLEGTIFELEDKSAAEAISTRMNGVVIEVAVPAEVQEKSPHWGNGHG